MAPRVSPLLLLVASAAGCPSEDAAPATITAAEVAYDDSASGLMSTNVQDGLDDVAGMSISHEERITALESRDPLAGDSDGDGAADWIESAAGTDPASAGSVPADSNGDAVYDVFVGPAGSDGADGPQGPTGPVGPAGPQGLAGSFVKSSVEAVVATGSMFVSNGLPQSQYVGAVCPFSKVLVNCSCYGSLAAGDVGNEPFIPQHYTAAGLAQNYPTGVPGSPPDRCACSFYYDGYGGLDFFPNAVAQCADSGL